MLRDRGTIKWTALMLPEHIKMLREWKDEEKKPVRRQPDEQEYEEWNYRIAEAMEYHKSLTITHWREGKPLTNAGFIHHMNPATGVIRMVTNEFTNSIIRLCDIENISQTE